VSIGMILVRGLNREAQPKIDGRGAQHIGKRFNSVRYQRKGVSEKTRATLAQREQKIRRNADERRADPLSDNYFELASRCRWRRCQT